jgi:phytanoyl-CoA hydroxylase
MSAFEQPPTPLKFLTPEQVAFYHKEGYLVLPNFWSAQTVADLKDRMADIVRHLDFTENPNGIFTTTEQRRATNEYFLESGRAIRFFWEEKALDKATGALTRAPELSINKIGHGLHDLDPVFEQATYEARVGQICRDLGLHVPLAVQSMYIFKQAHVGGEVGAHQDGSFLYTEPQSVIGFWWALDDCTLANGCLWAVPGSHTIGVHRRYRREDPPGKGTEFVPAEPIAFDLTGAVPLETPKGSLVILHSALVHYSAENTSAHCRHAYSVHVVEGSRGVKYPADNWLQRPQEHPFRTVP